MPTTIKLKNSVTTTSVPSSLVQGEVAINITDKKVWVGNAATTPIQIAGAGTTGNAAGSNTQVQYNSSGSFAGDADFTFNGTTVTMANDASISGLTVGKGGGAVATNTALGVSALTANTTGSLMTAVGYQALQTNSTGDSNTAVGYRALNKSTGTNCTAIGYLAAYTTTSGANNNAMGTQALYLNTTGASNTALGDFSLYSNTTASNNTAVGYQAGYSNTTGTIITAIGRQALYNNTTGTDNTALGYAMVSNTTGSYNTGIGLAALQSNTTANGNTAVGYQSMYSNTTGYDCVAIGHKALYSHTTGDSSIAIGSASLQNLTTGRNNTVIGYQAGFYTTALTTGAQNILIGAYTRTSAATSNYQFIIGYDVVGQADNNITIGTTSGKIYNSFTVNATWTQTSDGRLKKNIQDETLGLSFINRLKPVKYEWKASNELDKDNPYYAEENKRTTGVVMHGLVAQDVKAALDAEGINTFAGWDEGSDGIQSISREMFISPLIKAIQELNAKVEAQALEIATLKGN